MIPKPPPGSANSSPKGTSRQATSIPATSSLSSQMTLWDTPSATSSPASAAGHLDSYSPVSPTPPRSGPAPALASLSVSQARASGRVTRVTFGRTSAVSSASAALQSSLESKLHQRLAATGSPEYVLTWKHWPIAQQQPICALRAGKRTARSGFCVEIRSLTSPAPSPPLTSASASGGVLEISGWVSPTAQDGSRGELPPRPQDTGIPLSQQVTLAGWTTPDAQAMNLTEELETWDARQAKNKAKHKNGNGAGMPLAIQVKTISGWAPPRAEDAESCGMRHSRGVADTLSSQVGQDLTIAGWRSPMAGDAKMRISNTDMRDKRLASGKQISLELEVHGAITTSSPAATAKRGALNPAHSRWLMGYPAVWDSCGVTAMQSCRKEPRTSSSVRSKRSKKSSIQNPASII